MWFPGSSCIQFLVITIFHPVGASGVALKQNVTFSYLWDNICGLRLYDHIKFNVSVILKTKRQDKCIEKSRSVLHNTGKTIFSAFELRACLHTVNEFQEAIIRIQLLGWGCIFLREFDASLYNQLLLVLKPRFLR